MNHIIVGAISSMHVFKNWEKSLISFYPGTSDWLYLLNETQFTVLQCIQSLLYFVFIEEG